MKVLITGGAGFLGTRLARALLQRGTLRGQRIERLVLADLAETREALGGRAALNLPALTVTVQQMLDALREVGGEAALRLVRFEPDADIARIVGGWPARFHSPRAQALGLHPDPDFGSIVRQYLQDLPAGAWAQPHRDRAPTGPAVRRP